MGQLLTHLQSKFGELHALNVLTVQNKMQHYHIESEGIPEYINTLKETQAKDERANNPIAKEALVIIATNNMLSTEKLPNTNKDRKELNVKKCT